MKKFNEKLGFDITRHPEGAGPSDHASFYSKQIPVLHFFTGTHSDYHRPSDTADKINAEGMERVTELVTDIALAVAEADSVPKFQERNRRAARAPTVKPTAPTSAAFLIFRKTSPAIC